MTTMLEKAARALAIEAGHDHPTIHHRRQARAVLMAVREPDEGAISAIHSRLHGLPIDPALGFTAMIDHILGEEPICEEWDKRKI